MLLLWWLSFYRRGDLVRIQCTSSHRMMLEHSIFKFACNSLSLNELLLHACKMLVSAREEEVRTAGPVLKFAVKFPGDIKGGELFFSLYVLFPAFLLSSFPFSHTHTWAWIIYKVHWSWESWPWWTDTGLPFSSENTSERIMKRATITDSLDLILSEKSLNLEQKQ